MTKKAPYRIRVKTRPRKRGYDVVIGLEVHTHLKSKTKLFCACPTSFGAAPNANVCPVCTGQPGALPVINRAAVAAGIRAALALNLRINPGSVFARKNYFYPDLPKGYQISQYDQPLSSDGYLDVLSRGEIERIGIERAHLEEDAGKLVHTGADGIAGADGSLVDLNRSSTPLLEIVSRPDISSPGQAVEYLRKMRATLIFAGAIEGHMEEGGLRCDANISLKPHGSPALGVKVEIKNLNSFRFLQKALEHEIKRQTRMLDDGRKIVQETRGFDPASETTFSMRVKEEAHDYRYFPEPDLLPLEIDDATVSSISESMPELPDEKRAKYAEWELKPDQIERLLADVAGAELFEACLRNSKAAPGKFAKWFLNVFLGGVGQTDGGIDSIKCDAAALAEIFALKEAGDISEQAAGRILARCIAEEISPAAVIEQEGLAVIRDDGLIEEVVEKVIAAHPGQVADYRAGSDKIFNYLVGQVMRELQGRADFKTAGKILQAKLDQPDGNV